MKCLNNYVWFIRESQKYMRGYNPVVVFFLSLYKGVGFCKDLAKG